MKDLLFALKSGFGWLSVIPVGISMEGVEALMDHVYVFPIVGLALGAILAAVSCMALQAFPAGLVAVTVIVAIYWLCGINHIDGLADFGDGVIAHGTQEKKIQAMKDVSLGTGGAVFICVLLLAMFAVLYSLSGTSGLSNTSCLSGIFDIFGFSGLSGLSGQLLPLALITAEVSAKEAMISFAAFSRSLQKGFGQIMIVRTGKKHFLIGLVISAAICALLLGALGLAVLAGAQLAAFYMAWMAERNFGGATGDGIGATNEVARVFALAVALALGGDLPWTLW